MPLPTASLDRYAPDAYALAAQEDRCAPRSKVSVNATLRPSGGQRFAVLVKDLSLAGFAAEAVTGMRSGAICWLTLPGLEGLQAEVVWNDGTMIGCSFAQLLNQAVLDLMLERYG
jgi:PilZ domain